MDSGNSFADGVDKERERVEKLRNDSLFFCPHCKSNASEDSWHWGYECCMDCFSDHAEDINYKHREQ